MADASFWVALIQAVFAGSASLLVIWLSRKVVVVAGQVETLQHSTDVAAADQDVQLKGLHKQQNSNWEKIQHALEEANKEIARLSALGATQEARAQAAEGESRASTALLRNEVNTNAAAADRVLVVARETAEALLAKTAGGDLSPGKEVTHGAETVGSARPDRS